MHLLTAPLTGLVAGPEGMPGDRGRDERRSQDCGGWAAQVSGGEQDTSAKLGSSVETHEGACPMRPPRAGLIRLEQIGELLGLRLQLAGKGQRASAAGQEYAA